MFALLIIRRVHVPPLPKAVVKDFSNNFRATVQKTENLKTKIHILTQRRRRCFETQLILSLSCS